VTDIAVFTARAAVTCGSIGFAGGQWNLGLQQVRDAPSW
jgi:hypothetical protein